MWERATKMVKGLPNFLKSLWFSSYEKRLLRGNLTEMYKSELGQKK